MGQNSAKKKQDKFCNQSEVMDMMFVIKDLTDCFLTLRAIETDSVKKYKFEECEQTYMYIINLFFKKKPQMKWAWRCTNASKSEIKYILAKKEHLIQDCTALNNFNTGNNHTLVRYKLLLNTKVGKRKLLQHSKKAIVYHNAPQI